MTTNGGDTYDGLNDESPGCTWHPGNDNKGYLQLLKVGNDKPTCDGQVGSGTGRRRVCACNDGRNVYKMSSQKMTFAQAKLTCQNDGSVLAMPRTKDDVIKIKELFDCKYCALQ